MRKRLVFVGLTLRDSINEKNIHQQSETWRYGSSNATKWWIQRSEWPAPNWTVCILCQSCQLWATNPNDSGMVQRIIENTKGRYRNRSFQMHIWDKTGWLVNTKMPVTMSKWFWHPTTAALAPRLMGSSEAVLTSILVIVFSMFGLNSALMRSLPSK